MLIVFRVVTLSQTTIPKTLSQTEICKFYFELYFESLTIHGISVAANLNVV